MDPRVAARRRQVRLERQHRRRRRTLALLGVVAVAAVAVAAVRSPLFAVSDVRVNGVDGARAAAVREAAGVVRGQNLLDADLVEAEARVRALPWVRSADAHRAPPAAVVVAVAAREPVAVVHAVHGAWQVDAEGYVVGEATGDQSLPVIVAENAVVAGPGERLSDAGALAALQIRTRLSEPLASQAGRYTAATSSDVVLQVLWKAGDQPATVMVRFGDAQRLAEKEQATLALLGHLDAQSRLRDGLVLDVRAPSAPVVVPV